MPDTGECGDKAVVGEMIRRGTVMAAACMALAAHSTNASAKQVRTVETVEGWTIKSRANAEGKFLACSMERFFVANKGEGRFRINIIAWPQSVIVLLRGNNKFLTGEGVAQFDIVSNQRQLFSGNIRVKKSELLFALNGPSSRQDVAASSGWSVLMNGRRVARFPMNGAGAAMAAVEKCAGLDQQVAATSGDQAGIQPALLQDLGPAGDKPADVPAPAAILATERQLRIMARNFSLEIDRPDFRMNRFEDGVLQWSYGDGITSGAATVTRQSEPAAAYAGSLAIRPDQCGDSVLTLPMSVRPIRGGTYATVVSMCRGKTGVTVRHVHVATLGPATAAGDTTTYVLNYETLAGPDGTGIPRRSDELAGAFGAALAAVVGG